MMANSERKLSFVRADIYYRPKSFLCQELIVLDCRSNATNEAAAVCSMHKQ